MATQQEILQFVIDTSGDEKMVALARSMLAAGEAGKAATPELEALAGQFEKLSAQDDLITKFVSEKAALAGLSEAMNAAGARLNDLQGKISATETPSAALQRSFERQQSVLQDLSLQYGLHQAALEKTGNALSAAGIDTTKLDTAQRAVKQSLLDTATAAATLTSNVANSGKSATFLESISGAASRVGKSFSEAAAFVGEFIKRAAEITGITALITGLVAAVSGFEFFKAGAEDAASFDKAMAKLAATSGLTGAALEEVKKTVQEVASSTNVGADEAATALATLSAQLGGTGAGLQALQPTILLSKAAQVDLSTAVNTVAESLKAFHLPASDAATVADTLAAVAQKTGANLGELTGEFGKLAPQATQLGLSFKDTVSILGLLQTQGIGAATASRSLATVFAELNNPTSALREQIVSLGIDTSSFTTIVNGLAQAGPRGEQALVSLGARGSNALLALVQAGKGSLADFEQSIGNVGGAAEALAARVENNLSDAARNFGRAFKGVAGELEEGAFEPLTKEVQSLTDRIKQIPNSAGFAQIKQAITDFTTGAIQSFEGLLGSINFKELGANIASFISDAGAKIKSFVSDASGSFAALGTAANVVGSVFNSLTAVIFGLAGVFDKAIQGAISFFAVMSGNSAALFDETSKLSQAVAAFGDAADENFARAKNATSAAVQNFNAIAGSLDKAGNAAATATPKQVQHTAAVAASSEQMAKLKAQYDALPPSVQKILGPLDDVIKRLQGTKQSAEDAAPKMQLVFSVLENLGIKSGLATNQLLDLQGAFSKLGVTSQDVLRQAANDALTNFSIIEKAADNTAAGLANRQNAFLAYAQKALAASAQLDEGTRDSIEANLESKAAVLGVTAALAELEKQSDNSAAALTSDSARYAASLKDVASSAQQVGDNTKAAGQAAQDASQKYDRFKDVGEEGFAALVQGIANTRAGFLSLSEAAAQFYDSELKGIFDFTTESDSAGAGFQRVAEAMALAADVTSKAIANQRNQLSTEISLIGQLGTDANKSFGSFGEDAAKATAKMSALADLIKEGKYQAGLLGQADLQPLQQALEAAAQRAQQLADAEANAKQQLADLNNQLLDQIDQQTGNQTDQEDRRYQQQLAQIQQLYAQSGKLGTADYNQAVANAKKLHDLKMQQIQQEQDAQNGTTSTSGSSATSTTSGAVRGSGAQGSDQRGRPLAPVHIHINGQQQSGTIHADVAGAELLQRIFRDKTNSIAG